MAMIDYVISLDQSLLKYLNGSDSVFLDGIMWGVSKTFSWLALYACLLFIIFRTRYWKDIVLLGICIIVLITLCDQFSSSFAKPFFQRLRPSYDPHLKFNIDLVNSYKGGRYGFISSHAANTFGVSTFFSFLIKEKWSRLSLFVWAILVSYSRMYLGVHFPLDIFFGALSGFLWGSIIYIIYRKIHGKENIHLHSNIKIKTWNVNLVICGLLCSSLLIFAEAFFFMPSP